MQKLLRFSLLLASVAAVGMALSTVPQAQAHPDYGCNSCHVPHAAHTEVGVPLWNPAHTTTTLTGNYTSHTMDATTSAPDGASKLCLSCHDGSYGHISDGHRFGGENALGGLQSNHPISFVYDSALAAADGELVDPTTLPKDVLDQNGKMQCTSCHDVHATTATETRNLRWAYESSYGVTAQFCRNCHLK